jgi:hypothetical protein
MLEDQFSGSSIIKSKYHKRRANSLKALSLSSNELLIDDQESNLGCNSRSIGGLAKGNTEGNGGLLARIEDSITVKMVGSKVSVLQIPSGGRRRILLNWVNERRRRS